MAVVVVSTGDSASQLTDYRDQNGIGDWVVFAQAPGIWREYSIRQQSSKVAIGSDGVILERRGYGGSTFWPGILNRLLEA